MLERLDDALQDAAQKLSDGFWERTGRTKFFLQKLLTIMSLMFFWVFFAFEVQLGVYRIVIIAVLTLSAVAHVWQHERDEVKFLESRDLQFRFCHLFALRILYVFISVVSVVLFFLPGTLWLLSCVAVSILAEIYVGACVPQFPTHEKQKSPIVSDAFPARGC